MGQSALVGRGMQPQDSKSGLFYDLISEPQTEKYVN